MATDIRAILRQRAWLDWVRQNLVDARVIPESEAQEIRTALAALRKKCGPARCFEHDDWTFEIYAAAAAVALSKIGQPMVIAIFGDPAALVLIQLRHEEVPRLLSETAKSDQLVTITTKGATGEIVLDAPNPDDESDEGEAAGRGTFENIVDVFKERLGKGVEFRGN